jgi:O-antigen ligase
MYPFHQDQKSASIDRLLTASLVMLIVMFASALTSLVPVSFAESGRWISLVLCTLVALVAPRVTLPSLVGRASGFQAAAFIMVAAYGISTLDSIFSEKSQLYWAVCALQVFLFTQLASKLGLQAWRTVYLSMLVMCAGVCVAALLGYSQNPERYVVQGRLAGTTNANSTALIAMLGAVLGCAALLSDEIARNLTRRLLLLGCVAACLPSLVLTGSRGSLGGLVIGFATVAIVYGGVSRRRLLLLVAVAVGPALIAAMGSNVNESLSSVYARADSDDILYSRREVWEASLDVFRESPWFGSGYGVHDAEGGFIDGSGYHGLLASVGLVGLIAFFGVAAWMLLHLWHALRAIRMYPAQLSGNRELLGFAAGCFTGLLAQGIGEPWTIGPGAFAHLIFWLSAGACVAGITMVYPPLQSASMPQAAVSA